MIGVGRISLRAHLPVIAEHPRFALVANADPHAEATAMGGPHYADYRMMLAQEPAIESVAICTPPGVRCRIALDAIAAGKHVLLEKPPCATLGELRLLQRAAESAGVTLMASWHSRYGLAAERAREVLANEQVAKLEMIWKENGAAAHPRQDWIWKARGFGVLEFGINGLSILTHILPAPLVVRAATLWVPNGAETPIAARIDFAGLRDDDDWHAGMDWRSPVETRSIDITTVAGRRLRMPTTGHRLDVDGQVLVDEGNLEYRRLYDRFADLIDRGDSDVDDAPLLVIADACLIGSRHTVDVDS